MGVGASSGSGFVGSCLSRLMGGCGSLIGGGAFVVLALGLLGFAGYSYLNTQRRMDSWVRVTGEVVDYERTSDGEGGTITMPVVEYTTTDGDVVRARPYEERNTDVDAGGYDIGDTVTVYYNPENPRDMFINDFMHVWFTPVLLGGLGTLFGGIGGIWTLVALGAIAFGSLRRGRT
jgi:hypothetical protein